MRNDEHSQGMPRCQLPVDCLSVVRGAVLGAVAVWLACCVAISIPMSGQQADRQRDRRGDRLAGNLLIYAADSAAGASTCTVECKTLFVVEVEVEVLTCCLD